jgi:hypothetical protein
MLARPEITVAAVAMLAACAGNAPASGGPAQQLTDSEAQTVAATWQPFSCGPDVPMSPACLDLVRQYEAALPEAWSCGAGDTCAALRPQLVYEATSSAGPRTLEGFCQCPARVNEARAAKLDAALGRFLSSGCPIECCPACPWDIVTQTYEVPAPVVCSDSGPNAGTCGSQ